MAERGHRIQSRGSPRRDITSQDGRADQAQHYSVEHAKDRGVGADSYGQSENGRGRVGRRLAQRAQCVAYISHVVSTTEVKPRAGPNSPHGVAPINGRWGSVSAGSWCWDWFLNSGSSCESHGDLHGLASAGCWSYAWFRCSCCHWCRTGPLCHSVRFVRSGRFAPFVRLAARSALRLRLRPHPRLHLLHRRSLVRIPKEAREL